MNKQEQYEDFRLRRNRFINRCDAIEAEGLWDKDAMGEMEAYYQNDLISVVLQLISSDGDFSGNEVSFVNEVFGFTYTKEELSAVYTECGGEISASYEKNIVESLSRLRGIDECLAVEYRDLVLSICDIVAESDGFLMKAECELLDSLRRSLT